MAQIGCITEQGDLGLGFDLLNEHDNKIVNKAMERENKDKTDKDKEDK